MNRGYFKGQKRLKDAHFRDFDDDTAPGSRHRSRKSKPLTLHDKLAIVHKVLVEKEMQKDVAKEMRISAAVVTSLVKKFRQ